MASKDQMIAAYRDLMTEIKVRNDTMNVLLTSDVFPPWFVRESCYLQLRMTCELVALACVVAHEDLPQAAIKKLRKDYHPERILNELGRIDPHFFPAAVRHSRQNGIRHVQPAEGQFLDRQGLKQIWVKSGAVLHRGSVNNLSKPQPIEKDFKDIREPQAAIVDLLNEHIIFTNKGQDPLMCFMLNLEGGVTVAFATSQVSEEDKTEVLNRFGARSKE